MRVIVTRPLREAQLWVKELEMAGVDAVALPLIEIEAVPDAKDLHQRWKQIDTYAGVMFVSGNAATHFHCTLKFLSTKNTGSNNRKTATYQENSQNYKYNHPGTLFRLLGRLFIRIERRRLHRSKYLFREWMVSE